MNSEPRTNKTTAGKDLPAVIVFDGVMNYDRTFCAQALITFRAQKRKRFWGEKRELIIANQSPA